MATQTTPEEMKTNVKNLLKTLGTGPNKIAETLTSLKIKGTPMEAGECPITKFVKKNYKALKNVATCVGSVEFSYRGEYCEVDLPKAIDKFIEKFDKGDYSNLSNVKSSIITIA